MARADAQRSEGEAVRRKAEQAQRRVRASMARDRVAGRASERARGRARAVERMEEMARAAGLRLEGEMREVGGVGRLREGWRWSFTPAGEREQLVLFNHGVEGGPADQEVRAAILESEYGRGLYYASDASRGREIGYYDGEEVTHQEYCKLDEYTGLRHTLEIDGKLVNGLHGVTGLQYANTSRKGVEANNAGFCDGSAIVRVSAAGGVVKGQPVLIPYRWKAAAWEEIESRVVGVCAYEERGPGQGLGEEGGTYVVEWASALRRGGLGTQMLREARKGWAKGRGRVELQVHVDNKGAIKYYTGLRMRKCRWWEGTGGGGGRGGGRVCVGESMYEPDDEHQMMQVSARELEQELDRRAERHEPVTGIEYIRVRGVQGLSEAGLLKGVRAMMARIYGGEEWYVNGNGRRIECLYGRDNTVQYIVAVKTGDDGWARRRARRGDDEGGGRGGGGDGAEGDGGEEGGEEGAGRGGGKSGTGGAGKGGRTGRGGGEEEGEEWKGRERGWNGREGGAEEKEGGGKDRKRKRREDAAGGDRQHGTVGVG